MSTITPSYETPTEHNQRLCEACAPMPVKYFKAAKAAFYTAVMMLVAYLTLIHGADATIVFAGFVVFLVVFVTETKDVELAGLLSATFYRSNGRDREEDE